MIASIKTLFDLVTGVMREHRDRRQGAFANYATPLYDGAKKVVDDYLKFFADLKKIARNSKTSLPELVELIYERRHATLTTRHELRAYIADFGERESKTRASLPAFEQAILGIMEGAFTVAHSMGHFRARIQEQIHREAARPGSGGGRPSRANFIADLVREIDTQASYLEVEFAIVATHYAAMRAKQSPKTKLKRKRTAA